jgi:hypothetical protein
MRLERRQWSNRLLGCTKEAWYTETIGSEIGIVFLEQQHQILRYVCDQVHILLVLEAQIALWIDFLFRHWISLILILFIGFPFQHNIWIRFFKYSWCCVWAIVSSFYDMSVVNFFIWGLLASWNKNTIPCYTAGGLCGTQRSNHETSSRIWQSCGVWGNHVICLPTGRRRRWNCGKVTVSIPALDLFPHPKIIPVCIFSLTYSCTCLELFPRGQSIQVHDLVKNEWILFTA